jgi:hypothetical protein
VIDCHKELYPKLQLLVKRTVKSNTALFQLSEGEVSGFAAGTSYQNNGLYEWDTLDGQGRGSAQYAGSAGVLGQAVIEGLFGVDWRYDHISVMPRMGLSEGYLYLPQPGSEEFLAYRYVPNAQGKRLSLHLNSNVRTGIRIQIPTPFASMTVSKVMVNG